MSKSLNLRRSQAQELDTARKFGGNVNSGSGNKWHTKNDVRTSTVSIECKVTEKNSYSLKLADWQKAVFNAAVDNRDALFKITFLNNGNPINLIIMDENDYLAKEEQMHGIETETGTS